VRNPAAQAQKHITQARRAMKKCRRCSKPATLHITELRDGAVHELHLCEGCAQEYLHNPEMSQEPDEADQLAAKLTEATGVEDLRELDHLVCPNCGITFREFRSQGRLGCPHDYIAFEAELTPLLENIHGETQHTGKFPRRAPDASQRQYELIRLRSQLRTAVGEEAYEEAARLRDAIQTLERDLGAPGEAE
jgi:protein arginine kinase activator